MKNTDHLSDRVTDLVAESAGRRTELRRYFVICYHRGGSRHKQFSRAIQSLCESGAEVTIRYCDSGVHARQLARTADVSGYDAILAAGGDGLVNDVVTGLAQRKGEAIPLFGVLPVGTGNAFAQELGFRGRALASLPKQLVSLRPRKIYFGRVSGAKIFTLISVVGFGPQMMEKLSDRLKKHIGNGAYVLAALVTLLTYKSHRYRVELNGEHYSAYTVLVVNACLSDGPIPLVRGASLREPKLHVCLVERPGRLFLTRLLWSLVRGKLSSCDGFRIVECTNCRISGSEAANSADPVMIDGDNLASLPAEFSIEETPLMVLGFPEGNLTHLSR